MLKCKLWQNRLCWFFRTKNGGESYVLVGVAVDINDSHGGVYIGVFIAANIFKKPLFLNSVGR